MTDMYDLARSILEDSTSDPTAIELAEAVLQHQDDEVQRALEEGLRS